MTRSLLLAIIVVSTVLPVSAQESASPAKLPFIAGTVVIEPGSEPLKKALVQVVGEDQKQGGNYTTLTDGEGHFRVEQVLPGRYQIFVERAGFVGVNERGLKADTNLFTVRAGQPLEDVIFRMLPTAVISGRVTDEDGDPMPAVAVIIQKKKAGRATRETVGSGTTNDLGDYRVAGLFPGQYWIVALPPPDFRDYERQQKSADAENKARGQSDRRYITTYYPGTYDASQATPVMLKAGDEMPVNLTLAPAQTYCVRGTVTGGAAGQKPAVELFSKAGDSIHANASDVGPDGQFEIRGVPPGSYELKLAPRPDLEAMTAHQEIQVVAADVEGVRLAPQPSFTLSGHLRIESGTSSDPTQYAVNLRSAEAADNPGFFMAQNFFETNASVDRLGNFTWKDVNRGAYIVRVVGGDALGFFVKSVTLGGRDITTGFATSGPATIDVLVSTKAGRIDGSVVSKDKDGDDHPIANATVVAVPEEKYRKLPERFETASTDQQGGFTIRGLAPGSYLLYAWQDLDDEQWLDAGFLKSQEANGTTVKVEEGSNQRVELTLSAVGDEWR